MSTQEMIKVEHVTKKYRKQLAVNDISFSIKAGEIVGLVGPNGAGKSTIMSIMAGLIQNYDGNVYIKGKNIREKSSRTGKQVGCVIEAPGLYPQLTGYQNLKFFAEMIGGNAKTEIDRIVEMLGLEKAIHKKAGKYSLGMKQRLGIAQAVLGNPYVLVLDEPTNGLDPNVIPELRKFIKYVAEEKGISVLISSHILSEIEAICEKVLFIQNGKIIKEFYTNEVETGLANVVFETSQVKQLLEYFKQKQVNAYLLDDKAVIAEMDPSAREMFIKEIVNDGITILGVYEQKQSLEEKFLKVMGGNSIE